MSKELLRQTKTKKCCLYNFILKEHVKMSKMIAHHFNLKDSLRCLKVTYFTFGFSLQEFCMYNVHRIGMNDEKYTKKRAQPSLPTSLSGQKIHYMKRADVGWWPPTTHLWKQIARNISAWTGRIFSLMLTKNMCDCRPWFILIFHVSVCAADTIVHIPWSLDIWRDPLQVPAGKSGGSITL